MMKKYKDSLAVDIGLRLPHSQGTMEFLKRSNLELYFTLMKINGKDKVEFSDVMVLEHNHIKPKTRRYVKTVVTGLYDARKLAARREGTKRRYFRKEAEA